MTVFAFMGSVSISYWEVNDLILFVCFGFVLFDLWPEKKTLIFVPLLSTKPMSVISTLYSSIIQDISYEDIKIKIYIFLRL